MKLFEDYTNYSFEDEHLGFNHGQHNFVVMMYDGQELLARCYYCEYGGLVYITFIESIVKGKGYGSMIMDYLANKYGYENLERSSLTPEGAKMRSKLDKKYNFDYMEHKKKLSKLFDVSLLNKIKNPIVKDFLHDMIRYGSEKTWEKWLDYIRENNLDEEYDFNDIADLSKWFKDSKTLEHSDDEEPPIEELEKLF